MIVDYANDGVLFAHFFPSEEPPMWCVGEILVDKVPLRPKSKFWVNYSISAGKSEYDKNDDVFADVNYLKKNPAAYNVEWVLVKPEM